MSSEIPEGLGLGRLLNHDPKSRNFPAPTAAGPVRSVVWTRYGQSLDQGNLGSCTGNALAHWHNTRPNHAARKPLDTEADALAYYTRATQLDPFAGQMPDEDTGSDGNSVCKAGREAGILLSWTHVFGFDHLLNALQHGSVLTGSNWYPSMFNPSPAGYVEIGSGERPVGGHEYLYQGVNLRDRYLWAVQSWGPTWGLKGRFKIPFEVARRLLAEDGDATQPVAA
jgi:hypothetical protein